VPLNFVGIENQNVQIRVVNLLDILGRKNNQEENKLLFHIFDNGTIEKKIIIE